jgi:hypothetical protein
VGFCDDQGHVALGRETCERRGCPKDWADWVRNAAESVVERVAAFRTAQDGAGKRAAHVVVSPPQDRTWSARELWDARSEAYRAAEAAGVRGGAVITHPYRTTDRADMLYETATEAGDWDRGKWSFLRDLAGDAWGGMREYVEPAPHYHMIAPVGDVQPSAAPEGWVVKRVRTFGRWDYRDVEAYRDLFGAALYTLSHAAVQQGRSTVTYFGEIHPAAFDPTEELTAGKWDRIQQLVGVAPDTSGGVGAGGSDVDELEPCDRDGCDGTIRPLDELREYLANPPAGWDRRAEYRAKAVQVWVLEEGDRPPPSVRGDELRVREWLEETGRLYHGSLTAGTEQVTLGE